MKYSYIILGFALLSLFAFGNKESPKKPIKQSPKQKEISGALEDLEQMLGLKGLHDVFMGFAKVESNFVPSATRPEPNGYNLVENNIGKLYANPWIKDKSLWQKTMGLFQQFPGSALLTSDGYGINLNPEILYDWRYSVALAVDFAYRLHKKYEADNFLQIRLGWASLKTLNSPNSSYAIEVMGRLLKGISDTGGDTKLIYSVPDWKTYEQMGFKNLLNYILNKYDL